MRLRRLFKTVVSRDEHSHFEERKLCRKNLVQFLSSHLTNPCERARYLALDLLCGAVPRLGNKTDVLLMPILPKIFQCFREDESKCTKLKAFHFLRMFFRHTKDMPRFVDQFVKFGACAKDASFFYGVGIVFDQDIGDDLYAYLIAPLSTLMTKENEQPLTIPIYRALKRFHEMTHNERFYKFLRLAGEDVQHVYANIFKFEKCDPFLNSRTQNIASLVTEYLKKSKKLRFSKAFGVVDLALLERIAITRDCEQAVMVNKLAIAFKRASCDEYDLECHLVDLLKLVCAFLSSSNRPVQISGFDILKQIVQKMGYYTTPYISCVVNALRESLTSPNSKIKIKTEKVLNRLMHYIHPMTVIWELLHTNDALQMEAILCYILKELKCFPYYQFDLVALSNCIGFCKEYSSVSVQKASQDCMIVLLSIMRASPVPGIRTEASRIMLHNYCLKRSNNSRASSIGNLRESIEEDFNSQSSEDDETDTPPTTVQSTLISMSLVSMSTKCSAESEWQTEFENCDTPKVYSKTNIAEDEIVQKTAVRMSEVSQRCYPLQDSRKKKDMKNPPYISNIAGNENILWQETRKNHLQTTINNENSDEKNNSSEIQSNVLEGESEFEEQLTEVSYSGNDISCGGGGDFLQISNSQPANSVKCEMGQEAPNEELFVDGGGDYYNPLRDTRNDEGNFNKDTSSPNEEQLFSENAKETKVKNSSACHVEVLDPSIYNFNILMVTTPKTMESIQEMDEIDGNEFSEPLEVLPSIISTPDGYYEIPGKEICVSGSESILIEDDNYLTDSKHRLESGSVLSLKDRKLNSGITEEQVSEFHDSLEHDVHKKTMNSGEVENFYELDSPSDLMNIKLDSLPSSAMSRETLITESDDWIDYDVLPGEKRREIPRTPITATEKAPKVTMTPQKLTKSKNKQSKLKDDLEIKAKNSPEIVHRTSTKVKQTVKQSRNSLQNDKITQDELPTAEVTLDKDRCGLSSGSKHEGCPWQRDIEFAMKAGVCEWAQKFEKIVEGMKPFPTNDAAEAEMKKSVDDLFGKSWKLKEQAMLTVICLAKHHPVLVSDNSTKIIVAVCNEVKNFRQSVAGKAILTCGHLFVLLGRRLENKLRLVVAVLLGRSGNRTLAAYFRLVIQSLFKIVMSTSPQKAALAFIQEGSRHPNKASRETAAQFLVVLTETVGPLNTLSSILACQMLKCASLFVFDCSAITRYCGKRMFQVFMTSPNFEKLKDHYLDVNTTQNLTKVLEQIETKGVSDEILPINVLKESLK